MRTCVRVSVRVSVHLSYVSVWLVSRLIFFYLFDFFFGVNQFSCLFTSLLSVHLMYGAWTSFIGFMTKKKSYWTDKYHFFHLYYNVWSDCNNFPFSLRCDVCVCSHKRNELLHKQRIRWYDNSHISPYTQVFLCAIL